MTGELLSVDPQELQFAFESKKHIACSLTLSNRTDNYVAFKMKTTNPKKYSVIPNIGVVLPRTTCTVVVTMQAQMEAPGDMQCKDKFLLQGVVASPGATVEDISPEMFNKESGHQVDEWRLTVVYVAPPLPPSPVCEEPDNGTLSSADFASESSSSQARTVQHNHHDNSLEVKTLISKLNSVIQQNNKLQQELDLLRREVEDAKTLVWLTYVAHERRSHGIPRMYVALIGLIGIIFGYLLQRT